MKIDKKDIPNTYDELVSAIKEVVEIRSVNDNALSVLNQSAVVALYTAVSTDDGSEAHMPAVHDLVNVVVDAHNERATDTDPRPKIEGSEVANRLKPFALTQFSKTTPLKDVPELMDRRERMVTKENASMKITPIKDALDAVGTGAFTGAALVLTVLFVQNPAALSELLLKGRLEILGGGVAVGGIFAGFSRKGSNERRNLRDTSRIKLAKEESDTQKVREAIQTMFDRPLTVCRAVDEMVEDKSFNGSPELKSFSKNVTAYLDRQNLSNIFKMKGLA